MEKERKYWLREFEAFVQDIEAVSWLDRRIVERMRRFVEEIRSGSPLIIDGDLHGKLAEEFLDIMDEIDNAQGRPHNATLH
jgi:hypothetical protein